VARKTTNQLRAADGPRHGLPKILRLCQFAAGRKVESFQDIEVRNAAFVELCVLLEKPRLANMAIAEGPRQRSGNTSRAVRNHIDVVVFRPPDLVANLASLKSQPIVTGQNIRVRRQVRGTSHRRIFLRGSFAWVTSSASGWSHILMGAWSAVPRPPATKKKAILGSRLSPQHTRSMCAGSEE